MSNIDEILTSEPITVKLHPETTAKAFHNVNEILRFYQEELRFWKEMHPTQTVDMMKHQIAELINYITNFPTNSAKNETGARIRSQIAGAITSKDIIYSSTEAAKYIKSLSVNCTQEQQLRGAIDYITGKGMGNHNDRMYFLGFFNAATYFHVSDSAKMQIETITGEYKNLFSDVAKLKSEQELAINNSNEEMQKTSQRLQLKLDEYQCALTNQRDELNKGFEQKLGEWNKKINALENIYEQKLALASPLRLWRKHADRYRRQGYCFSIFALLIGAISIFIVMRLLYDLPPLIFDTDKFSFKTIKGTLLVITIISILMFFLNLLVKFAVSAFHLSRDAEERVQLAYQFLALLKHQGIDNNNLATIVCQSLFSRADTGLLKGNQHIQMPSVLTGVGDTK